MANVVWSDRALAALGRIHAYVLAQDGQRPADDLVRRIFAAGNKLDLFPARYKVSLTSNARRCTDEAPYIILYDYDKETDVVDILDVDHGARDRP